MIVGCSSSSGNYCHRTAAVGNQIGNNKQHKPGYCNN